MLAAINTAPPEPFVPEALVGQKVVALLGCWCGDLEAGAAALAPLRDLGPAVDLFGPMPYPALQGMLDAGAPYGLRNYFRGGYVADLSDDVIATALEQGAGMPSPMSQIHFHQMGGAVGRFGTSTSSFSGRAAGYTYNLIGTWTEPAEDDVHIASVRAVSGAFAPLSLPAARTSTSARTATRIRCAPRTATRSTIASPGSSANTTPTTCSAGTRTFGPRHEQVPDRYRGTAVGTRPRRSASARGSPAADTAFACWAGRRWPPVRRRRASSSASTRACPRGPRGSCTRTAGIHGGVPLGSEAAEPTSPPRSTRSARTWSSSTA